MAYEHRTGQGTLFKNTSDNPRAPEYKGSFKDGNGHLRDIAGWTVRDEAGAVKRDKNGNPMMNLKISEPYRQEERQRSMQPNQERGDPGPQGPDEYATDLGVPF